MSEQVKMGLIIGAAIIIATGLWIYFSPFQSCVRGYVSSGIGDADAGTEVCARYSK